MYSNMKNYENIYNCLRVIQPNKNRKLNSANCWQQTSLIENFNSVSTRLQISVRVCADLSAFIIVAHSLLKQLNIRCILKYHALFEVVVLSYVLMIIKGRPIHTYGPRSDKRDLMVIKVKTGIFTGSRRPSCCEHFLNI